MKDTAGETHYQNTRTLHKQSPPLPPFSARAPPPGMLLGPLDGIPYAAKDNFCTLGVPTTASSDTLAEFTPPYDSTPVQRLRQSGSPMLGKTNMDEFGMGSGTLFSSHGPTLNPWSPGEQTCYFHQSGGERGHIPCSYSNIGVQAGISIPIRVAYGSTRLSKQQVW